MDQIDDLLLALETIDDIATGAFGTAGGLVIFRKKWYQTNDYGVQTVNYSDATTNCSVKNLPKLIESIKEAQAIAQQALTK